MAPGQVGLVGIEELLDAHSCSHCSSPSRSTVWPVVGQEDGQCHQGWAVREGERAGSSPGAGDLGAGGDSPAAPGTFITWRCPTAGHIWLPVWPGPPQGCRCHPAGGCPRCHPAPQGPAGISPALSLEPPLRIPAVPSAPQASAGGGRGVSQTIGMRHWGLKGTGFIFNRVYVLS